MRKRWVGGVGLAVVAFAASAAADDRLRFHIPDGWVRVWEAPGEAGEGLSADERARLEREHVVLAAVEPSIPGAAMEVTTRDQEAPRSEAALDTVAAEQASAGGVVVSRGFMDVHGAKVARVVIDEPGGAVRSAVFLVPGAHQEGVMRFRVPAAKFEGASRRIEASVRGTGGLVEEPRALRSWLGFGAGAATALVVGGGVAAFVVRRRRRA